MRDPTNTMWRTIPLKVRKQSGKKRIERIKALAHIIRVSGTVEAPQLGVKLNGHFLLNDIHMKGLGFFTSEKLPEGTHLSLLIQEPEEFTIGGRLLWCSENLYNSHIVSEKHFRYRMAIHFEFQNDEERNEVEAYLDRVYQNQLKVAVA